MYSINSGEGGGGQVNNNKRISRSNGQQAVVLVRAVLNSYCSITSILTNRCSSTSSALPAGAGLLVGTAGLVVVGG